MKVFVLVVVGIVIIRQISIVVAAALINPWAS
jgi:hypothetical protein